MADHVLKTHIEYFQEVKAGNKTFEVRKNDRDFKTGDNLLLKEYNPNTQEYTGGLIVCKVSYILSDFEALLPGFVILGIKRTTLYTGQTNVATA